MGHHRPNPGRWTAASRIGQLLPSAPVMAGTGAVVGVIVAAFLLPLGGPAPPGYPDLGAWSPAPQRASPSEPAPASPTPSPSSSPSPTPPPAVATTGEYALDELYDGVFIATVVVGNQSDQDSGWTVQLAYGGDVGELSNFWIDGAVQPSLERAGDRYVFSSAQDVGPGTAVALNVHFERSGPDISPTTCLVNGAECLIPQ